MINSRLTRATLATLALLGLAALAVSCGGSSQTTQGNPSRLQVVTSINLFADLIEHVGGDRVQVTALVPPGADPHTYAPVPSQAAKVAKADLVVINGLDLEQTLHDLIQNSARGNAVVVEMTAGLPIIGSSGSGAGNPHLWLNVQNAMHYVEAIRDGLIKADPANADFYRTNASAYLDDLTTLDKETAAAIQTIPPEQRKLVTYHDSFPYFAERYGLEVVGVVVESEGSEPSAQELANLADQIRAQNVPVVFTEPEFNAQLLDTVAEEAGVQVKTLLSDAYNDDVHSYVELIQFDTQQLVEGLGSP